MSVEIIRQYVLSMGQRGLKHLIKRKHIYSVNQTSDALRIMCSPERSRNAAFVRCPCGLANINNNKVDNVQVQCVLAYSFHPLVAKNVLINSAGVRLEAAAKRCQQAAVSK